MECTTLHGVQLQPYWMMILSSLVFSLGSSLVTYALSVPASKEESAVVASKTVEEAQGMTPPQKSESAVIASTVSIPVDNGGLDAQGITSQKSEPVVAVEEAVDAQGMTAAQKAEDDRQERIFSVFYSAPVFLFLQASFQLVHFASIVYSAPKDDSWNTFLTIYIRFVNSGIANLLPFLWINANFCVNHGGSEDYKTVSEKLFGSLACILFPLVALALLPAICVFVIPMGFAYIWYTGSVLLAVAAISGGLFYLCLNNYIVGVPQIVAMQISRTVFLAGCIFLVQTLLNIGVLLYAGGNYLAVIREEYEMRNTLCYFASVRDSAAQQFSLLSLLL